MKNLLKGNDKTLSPSHFSNGNIEALVNPLSGLDDIEDMIMNPEKYLLESELLKNSRSVAAGIWKKDSARTIFVKQYKNRGAFHSFRHAFKECRAFRSFNAGLKFREHGIEAPNPIAAVKEKILALAKTSYLFLDAVENIVPTAEFFQKAFDNPELANIYILNIAEILAKTHNAGIAHGDTKLSNFFVSCRPGLPLSKSTFGIWDFDSTAIFPHETPDRARIKDIARTLASFREMASRLGIKIDCNIVAEKIVAIYSKKNGRNLCLPNIIKATKTILTRKNLAWI